ncbi:SIMPL domain-containing protein [Aurantimonas sp. Leaf443]|uniref:SIMPL domain-containing protein n=1 Tax=Aurantimonas sp. Leaf443 TaxID=1736378 RepID=UPI0006FB0C8A|nr:SIMPL domain-containing protein [Aurantimonas sp. Leaf443]KQT83393.1 hypothetical protein ASG48_12570 [Aurantimonas sp. Leaf443]
MRPVILAAALLGATALADAPAALAQDAAPDRPRIDVTGTGEASGTPDLALASFTVLSVEETARAALDRTNETMARVSTAMKEFGIEARDLQTSDFAVSPQYRYDNDDTPPQNPPAIVGYEVRNTLSVRVRDLAKLGEILDKAVTLGVNQGGSLTFAFDDPAALREAARRDAVADARATAAVLAEAAGVTLGAVRHIEVGTDEMPPMPMLQSMKRMDAAPAPAVPVETGESTVRATVRMEFDIAP